MSTNQLNSSAGEAGCIPMGYTRDSHGRVLSYKTNDFSGIRIADDSEYVLHYDNTNDTFLAGCSGVLIREQAIKRWDRADDRALLYTLAIGVTKV